MTVVLETTGAETYVGRFDSEDERGVHMLDVGVHVAGEGQAAGVAKDEYIKRSAKFGIRADRKHVLVPKAVVSRITKLAELPG
jgi:hypothetical protein